MSDRGIFLFYIKSNVFTAQSHKRVTPPALRPEMRDPSHATDAVHVVYVVLFSPWKDTLLKNSIYIQHILGASVVLAPWAFNDVNNQTDSGLQEMSFPPSGSCVIPLFSRPLPGWNVGLRSVHA